ncbi:MAG: hypothetical protein GAK45_00013 [Pseudomonas citronellolis]|nr:MAG: hypothetical protein GAK45_00013 [Pseudomonas citronellolis]
MKLLFGFGRKRQDSPDAWPHQAAPGAGRGYLQHRAGQGHIDPCLGFDPDSPDITDPQVDPPHPPCIPYSPLDLATQRRAPGEQYPPYAVHA